ncbi:hypothetical protein BH10CHL1_BH10CHL1_01680 [soil metagenome]
MYEELMRDGELSQRRARAVILERFGYKFVSPGRIDTLVLKEWQKLTTDKVVWDAPAGLWRLKQGEIRTNNTLIK